MINFYRISIAKSIMHYVTYSKLEDLNLRQNFHIYIQQWCWLACLWWLPSLQLIEQLHKSTEKCRQAPYGQIENHVFIPYSIYVFTSKGMEARRLSTPYEFQHTLRLVDLLTRLNKILSVHGKLFSISLSINGFSLLQNFRQ